MTAPGLPHSEIPGSKVVCTSPGLIAAYHVLRRLLEPRHPPCALSSLTNNSLEREFGATRTDTSIVRERSPVPFLGDYKTTLASGSRQFRGPCASGLRKISAFTRASSHPSPIRASSESYQGVRTFPVSRHRIPSPAWAAEGSGKSACRANRTTTKTG